MGDDDCLSRYRAAAVFRAMPAGDKAVACAFGISLGFEPTVFPALFEFFGVSGGFSLKSNLSGGEGLRLDGAPALANV